MLQLPSGFAGNRAARIGAGCPTLILLTTAAYLFSGMLIFIAWRLAGEDSWIEDFFGIPGALLMVLLSGVGLVYSVRVWRGFETGEPMRRAWQLIALSAAAEFAGSLLVQVFGTKSRLNPLSYIAEGHSQIAMWRSAGLMLDGTCRFALLAVGLYLVLTLYRRAGFLGRLAVIDWVLLAIFGAYVIRQTIDVAMATRQGKHFTGAEIFSMPVDPLLWVLLSQALRLLRSVRRMGLGWVGKCYGAFSAGIVLVMLGDVAIWATNWGYLPWPWSALGWYVWIPAAAAFALAPCLQWDAMSSAKHGSSVLPTF